MPTDDRAGIIKQVCFYCVLAGLLVLFGVGAAELGLRLLDPSERVRMKYLLGLHVESRYVEDAGLGYRPRNTLYFWDSKSNGPQFSKPDGVVRVFALGDSFTKAHGTIGKEYRFYEQVCEALLRMPGAPTYEFFHFGVSGYCERQFLELLRRYGPQYSPDWAIIQVYLGNDIGENAGIIVRALGITSKNQHGIITLRDAGTAGPANSFDLSEWSHLYRFVRESIPIIRYRLGSWEKGSTKHDQTKAVDVSRPHLQNVNTSPHFIRLMLRQVPDELEMAWEITEELVKAIAQEAVKQRIQLVFVLVPQELQVNDPAWEEAVAMLHLDAKAFDRDLPSRRFSLLLKKHHVPVIDLTPAFRVALSQGIDLYDGHFGRAGHDLTADVILRGLEELGLTKSCPQVESVKQ